MVDAPTLNVSLPPRAVPLAVRLQVMLGGTLAQIGWLFLLIGSVVGSIFVVNSEVVNLLDFRGERVGGVGTVERVEQTSSSENKRRILAVHYRYQAGDRELRGVSYAVRVPYEIGAQVPVEMLRRAPERSRIIGMRRRPFGVGVGFVLLFPTIGLVFALRGLFAGLRAVRLLRIGEIGWGRLVRKEETNARVNKQKVYALTFRFRDPRSFLKPTSYRSLGAADPDDDDERGESHEVVCRTHETERLTDDAREPLLFDPERPERAVLLDSLPGHTVFEPDGQLASRGPLGRILIAPALSLLVLTLAFAALLVM